MLQHSLVGYKPFYDVKTAEDLEVKKGRAAIDYDAYIIVVHQVAANYDNRHSFKQKQRNDIQQVNQTNIHYEETDFGQIQDSMLNDMEEMIGTFGSICIPEARQNHLQNRRRPSLHREMWNSLSAEDQSALHKLSDKGKMAIMFAFKPTDAKKEVSKMERKINQNIIEEEGEFSDAIETSQEEPIGDTDYQIQAATMKNPADIHNILSSPRKQNPQERRTNQHII